MKISNSDQNAAMETWRKCSYSGGDGGGRPEGATWRKSSYSDGSGGNCLEVATGHPDTVPVRDSKAPDGPVLVFRGAAWYAFVSGVKRG